MAYNDVALFGCHSDMSISISVKYSEPVMGSPAYQEVFIQKNNQGIVDLAQGTACSY